GRSFLFRLALHVAVEVGPYLHVSLHAFSVWPLRILSTRQSFLLIVRTRHVVTVPSALDGTRSAGYSDVPAYSRVLQLPRSTDSYGRRLPGLSFAASNRSPNNST